MTEEQVKMLSALFERRDLLLHDLRQNRSPKYLRVQAPDDQSHWRFHSLTLHACTERQGAELLELIAKWNREELQAVERKITDMGVTLPAKEEA